jgi:DNA primase
VFCFDGDSAGRKAAWRALEVGLPLATDANPLRFLLLPEGEDPDSYVRAHGREGFERLIAQSLTLSGFLLGELRAQCDLSSPEGRSRFMAAARPHVRQLAAPMLRLQVMRAIAPLAQVTVEDVERLYVPEGAPRYRSSAPARASAPLAAATPEQGLLRCLAVSPALAEELDDELLDDQAPESGALREIAAAIAAGEALDGAMLVERFRGGAYEQLVYRAQAAVLDSHLDADGAAHEFRQLQIQLRIRDKHRQIEALKARVAGEPALNAELNTRIKELHQLKAQRS